jgi:hypothetical protein
MTFHPDKCSVLTITNKKNPVKHNYLLHNHTLESVSWGFQTEHAYSSFGRTRDRYACDFIFVLEVLRFLFKNPRLLFALATMLLACCVHFKSDWRVIPRYFAYCSSHFWCPAGNSSGFCSFSGIYKWLIRIYEIQPTQTVRRRQHHLQNYQIPKRLW